ncbi:MAG: hypothetical protein ACOX5R_19005 [bacterium]|jgi:hypothetical protein
MMKAVKLKGHITKDKTLDIQIPQHVEEGPVEVLLLIPRRRKPKKSLLEVLDEIMESPHPRMTKEEIDQYLEEERNSWE